MTCPTEHSRRLARWLAGKALATKPDGLGWIPESYTAKGENQLSQTVHLPTCIYSTCVHVHTHIQTCTRIHTHTYTVLTQHAYLYIHTHKKCSHSLSHTYTLSHTYIHIHSPPYSYIFTYTHTHKQYRGHRGELTYFKELFNVLLDGVLVSLESALGLNQKAEKP